MAVVSKYSFSKLLTIPIEQDLTTSQKNIVKQRDLEDSVICKTCGKANTRVHTQERGEWACQHCGIVHESNAIDGGKYWRAYTAEDSEKRESCGAPENIFLFDKGLCTVMGHEARDCNGSYIQSKQAQEFRHLSKLDKHTRPQHRMHNNYSEAMAELGKIASADCLNVTTSIQEQVAYRYLKILKSAQMKGLNIRYILLVLTYRTCLEVGDLRTIYEVTTFGGITSREFMKYHAKILQFFHLPLIQPKPKDYLRRIYTRLHIDCEQVYVCARNLCERLETHARANFKFVVGKDPAGVAGGALYLACRLLNFNRTQHEIGKVINVTEVTIRTRYKEIGKILDIPLDRIA